MLFVTGRTTYIIWILFICKSNSVQGDDPPEISGKHSEECKKFGLSCEHSCDVKNGSAVCNCLTGFELVDGHKCVDINECVQNNGNCEHICKNILGSFKCLCKPGFRLSKNRKSCEDINECHLRNGHGPCQEICENTFGSYKCSCEGKGTKLASDEHTCADVNECTEGISGCSHGCINVHGKSFCTCPKGLVLGKDRRTCKDINECNNPEIQSSCPYGCINLIGSYYCDTPNEEQLSDQPMENGEDKDYVYEDEEYDVGEEYEEENTDEYDQKETSSGPSDNKQENGKDEGNDEDDEYDEYEDYDDNNHRQTSSIPSTASPTMTAKIPGTTQQPSHAKEYDENVKIQEKTKNVKESHNEENDDLIIPEEESRNSPKEKEINHKDTDKEDEYDEEYEYEEYDENESEESIMDTVKEGGNSSGISEVEVSVEDISTDKSIPNKDHERISTTLETLSSSTASPGEEPTMSLIKEDGDRTGLGKSTERAQPTEDIANSTTPTERTATTNNEDPYKNEDENTVKETTTLLASLVENSIEVVDESDSQIQQPKEYNGKGKNIDEHMNNKNGKDESNGENDDVIIPEEESENSPEEEETDHSDNDKDDEYDEEYEYVEYNEKNDSITETIKEATTRSGILSLENNVEDISNHKAIPNEEFERNPTTLKTVPASTEQFEEDLENSPVETVTVFINEEENNHHKEDDENPLGETTTTLLPLVNNSSGIVDYDSTNKQSVREKEYDGNDKKIEEDIDEKNAKENHNEKNDEDSKSKPEEQESDHRDIDEEDEYDEEYEYEEYNENESNESSTENVNEVSKGGGVSNVKMIVEDVSTHKNITNEDLATPSTTLKTISSSTEQSEEELENNLLVERTTLFNIDDEENDYKEEDENEIRETTTSLSSLVKNSSGIADDFGRNTESASKTEEITESTKQDSANEELEEKFDSEDNNEIKGSHKVCEIGFIADGDECTDIDECSTGENKCSHTCENTLGSYQCYCPEGFRISPDNLTQCVDIDECFSSPCSDICLNTPGGFECKCPEGLLLQNSTHCVNLTCSHTKTKINGVFQCTCPVGFVLRSDGQTCEDIDECLIENTCSHTCENTMGSFQCSCPIGFELQKDERHCIDIDECITNATCPQVCENTLGSFKCLCEEGFQYDENKNQCADIDECDLSLNLSECKQVCINYEGGYECGCNSGYVLANDDVSCEDNDECAKENGHCSQICENLPGTFVCSCKQGFHLHTDKISCIADDPCLENNGGCSYDCVNEEGRAFCKCPDGYVLKGSNCLKIDPCAENNGGCSHICVGSDGTAVCKCFEGYALENDTYCSEINPCLLNNGNCSHICQFMDHKIQCGCPDSFTLVNGSQCIEENPCEKDNGLCSHFCKVEENKAVCFCPDTHDLHNGTHCVAKSPCATSNGECSSSDGDPCAENNGGCSHYCRTDNNIVHCYCPIHYDLINEKECVQINPCLVNNGGCSHDCKFDGGEVECICPEGYYLEGKSCFLKNPCSEKNGGCSHACTAVNGHAVCRCPPDFELIDKTCFRINPCTIDNGGCSHGCINDHGEAKCLCPPGYKLFGRRCLDEDPCHKDNGGCSHYCSNMDGKRVCSCPKGYILRPNKRTCKEINECRIDRGGCSHGCRNTPGSFECTCPNGFHLENNNRTCVDIDECATNNGGCEMLCKNYKGNFRCDCPEGYVLQKDKKTCKRGGVHFCRIPEPPKNGSMACPGHRTDYGLIVPSGTKCNVWCSEGFKLKGRPQRNCNENGMWDNLEAECVAATCPILPRFQSGWFMPGPCNTGKMYPGESCSVHCHNGRRVKQSVLCGVDLRWSNDLTAEALDRLCDTSTVQEQRDVFIKCPNNGRINFVLPLGQRTMTIRFPQPDTNIDFQRFIISQPAWGKRLENVLSVGTSEVKFSAVHRNRTASCTLTIVVEDKENPQVFDCPQNIEKVLDKGQYTRRVFWTEPQFRDNVEIQNIYKSVEPGSEFREGLHHVTYVATDTSGNKVSCQFTINIKGADYSEVSNSLQSHGYSLDSRKMVNSGEYNDYVLICPSGAQYKDLTIWKPEPGCRWKQVKVQKPQTYDVPKLLPRHYTPNAKNSVLAHYFQKESPRQPTNNAIPKIFGQSRLPGYLQNHRRKEYFRWNRR